MSVFLFAYRTLKSVFTGLSAYIAYFRCDCKNWQELVVENVHYELFITNSIGGGTAGFTKRYCASCGHILTVKNISYGRDWAFIIENTDTHKTCKVTTNDIEYILKSSVISKVTLNTLVTNLHTFWLLRILQDSDFPVTVMVHDYYLVCPKYTLFKCGTHCGFAFCDKNICIKDCNAFITPRCSLKEWREKWNDFLLSAKEVRCFSQSSKDIVRYAYPDIKNERITVVPHSMDYCHFTPVLYQREPLHVGIIGAITSEAKGSRVVRRFLSYAKEKNILVSVIGTYCPLSRVKGKTIHYTGAYRVNELQRTIEKEKVNCLLFPSLCSETFSYLVSEQIMMELPVVCFAYGAQAEKVRAYKKGIVCDSTEPEEIYIALKKAVQL